MTDDPRLPDRLIGPVHLRPLTPGELDDVRYGAGPGPRPADTLGPTGGFTSGPATNTTNDSPFAERLRQAVIRERVTAAAWRARRCADTVNVWWDAADRVDQLIEELAGREREAAR